MASIIKFKMDDTLNIDASKAGRLAKQAWFVWHLANLLKMLGQKYPDCEIGFHFHDQDEASRFDPDPNPDLYEIAVSRRVDEVPVVLFDIDPATWIIVAYGADFQVDVDNEFHGMDLREVVNPVA